MFNNLILLLTFISATIHIFLKRTTLTRNQIIDLYLLYFLIGAVGIIGGMGFIGHVFFANEVDRLIGWPTGSPFQFEVGFSDGAWALLGFLCIYFRGNFWLATAIGWSFFLLGATFGHIKQTLVHGNYAPYNYGIILPDLLVPVIFLILFVLKSRLNYSKST